MAGNLPLHLTQDHSERLWAVIEDARTRITNQLLDQGYAAEVIDLELALVYARCAARHCLDIASLGPHLEQQVARLEATNRALAAELRETLKRADVAEEVVRKTHIIERRKLADGRTMTTVRKNGRKGAVIR